MHNIIIFDFNTKAQLNNWQIVNDGVMGGLSDSNMYINEDGIGIFEGQISLENNGGFASVRMSCNPTNIDGASKIRLHVKGDKKEYQFRLRTDSENFFVYTSPFMTSGEWEVIDLELSELYPVFRGRRLRRPNYAGQTFEEIGILIGNKKTETFRLEFDKIELIKE